MIQIIIDIVIFIFVLGFLIGTSDWLITKLYGDKYEKSSLEKYSTSLAFLLFFLVSYFYPPLLFILQDFIYVMIFLLVWIILIGIIIPPLIVFYDFYDFHFHDFSFENLIAPFIILTFFLPFFLLIPTYYLLDLLPFINKSEIEIKLETESERLPKHIENLSSEAKRIRDTLSDINNLTINQVNSELKNTLKFIEKLEKEAIEQENFFKNLKISIENERKEAEEVQQIANSIEELTKPQLDTIKSLITADCKEETKESFWLSIYLSFAMGIATSLIASFITKFFKNMDVED